MATSSAVDVSGAAFVEGYATGGGQFLSWLASESAPTVGLDANGHAVIFAAGV